MSPQPATSRPRAWLMFVIVGALLFIVALASTSSMGRIVEVIPQPPKDLPTLPPETVTNSAGPSQTPMSRPPMPETKPLPDWFFDIIKAAAVMVVIIVIALFIWRLAQALSKRFADRAKAATAEAQEVPDIEDAVVIESLEQSITALRSGVAVDSAIVDCWRKLEQIAQKSGIRRRASQTAEEFTVEMLSHTAARHGDLAELADLYRAAMFSTHTFTDADRDTAIGCLERLAAALTATSASAQNVGVDA